MRRRRGQGRRPLSSALASTRSRGWLTAVTVFVVLYATLFTTFFTNPAGISGIVDGITYWAGQQSAARLAGYIPPYFYLLLLAAYELPVLVLGAVGLLVALRRRGLFDLYLAWWFGASLVTFSAALERVPWLLLHVLVPLSCWLFLGEFISARRWFGIALVLIGLIVVAKPFARIEEKL